MLYVEDLIGPDTVNTMPLETVRAFQDHGEVRDTLTEGVDEAHALLDDLAAAGVDYDDVVATLEDEGVQKFSESFDELREGITAKLRRRRRAPVTEAANPLAQGLGVRRQPDPCVLVVFGASGDLTKRKLLPALYSLAFRGLLPERFAVVGVARSEQTTRQFVDRDAAGGEAVRPRPVPAPTCSSRSPRGCATSPPTSRTTPARTGSARCSTSSTRRGGRAATGSTTSPSRRRRSPSSCARSGSGASARAGRG